MPPLGDFHEHRDHDSYDYEPDQCYHDISAPARMEIPELLTGPKSLQNYKISQNDPILKEKGRGMSETLEDLV
jgi:hypothetical protein